MSEQGDPTQSSRFENVLAEYLKRLDAGEPVDRQGLLREHPELASELESFFRNRDAIERLAAPLVQPPADTVILSDQASTNQEPVGRFNQVRYFGDYQLMEEIGRGAMGVVYRAEQSSLRRPVAVKMILRGALATAEDVERFHREAEAAANLDHPQIVSVF